MIGLVRSGWPPAYRLSRNRGVICESFILSTTYIWDECDTSIHVFVQIHHNLKWQHKNKIKIKIGQHRPFPFPFHLNIDANFDWERELPGLCPLSLQVCHLDDLSRSSLLGSLLRVTVIHPDPS